MKRESNITNLISNVDGHFASDISLLAESPNVGNVERLVLIVGYVLRTSDTIAQCIYPVNWWLHVILFYLQHQTL